MRNLEGMSSAPAAVCPRATELTVPARPAGSVYRSALSQAGARTKDAAMRKIVAGSVISLGDVAESPVD